MSKEINLNNKTVLISRTDSIGDVILTLPMVYWLKEKFPNCKIIFLGNTYTRPVLECCNAIDSILEWKVIEDLPVQQRVETFKELNADVIIHVFPNKEIAKLTKRAKIPFRIGTSHRSFHFLTCNIRPNFTRRKSDKHEAQLNFELLKSYGIKDLPSLDELATLMQSFAPKQAVTDNLKSILAANTPTENGKRIILHTKSQGSALEWGLENYQKLARTLSQQGNVVYYTGTEQDGAQIRGTIPTGENIVDVTGKMTLDELVSFINSCDALVACSTGPLHIAASLGIKAIGLYSSRKPIHPGRWMPIGTNAKALVYDENCETCKAGEECNCIENISVDRVVGEFGLISAL